MTHFVVLDSILPNELAETLSKSIPSFEHIEATPVEPKKVSLNVINNEFPPTYCDVLGCKTNLKMCATRHKNLNNHTLDFFECEDCEIGKKSYEMYMVDIEQKNLNNERKELTSKQDEIDKKRAAIMHFAQKLKARKSTKSTTDNNVNKKTNRRKALENKQNVQSTTDVSEARKKKLEKLREKPHRKRIPKSVMDK